MSSSSESVSWVDRWWPLLVILYGVLFVSILVTFSPTL
jgi:steroid 5-alpha reductase family enzyme